MSPAIAERKTNLEKAVSSVAGFPVEITIRSEAHFTWSADGNVDWTKARDFLLNGDREIVIEGVDYDEECDQSCLWFEVK